MPSTVDEFAAMFSFQGILYNSEAKCGFSYPKGKSNMVTKCKLEVSNLSHRLGRDEGTRQREQF